MLPCKAMHPFQALSTALLQLLASWLYIYRICHSSPCRSAALPGLCCSSGVVGREAASALLTMTVLEPTFSPTALPGDSSTPELHSNSARFSARFKVTSSSSHDSLQAPLTAIEVTPPV